MDKIRPRGNIMTKQETVLPNTVILGRPVLLNMLIVMHFVLSTTR